MIVTILNGQLLKKKFVEMFLQNILLFFFENFSCFGSLLFSINPRQKGISDSRDVITLTKAKKYFFWNSYYGMNIRL
jgi:hypothetical protein